MAYNALNNLIDAYIYANGVQAITGQILNGVLKQMVSELGSGYHLMGIAGPGTVPESNDYAMAYFAATAGEYTDFGGITLAAGEVAVLLTYGNGSWSKQTIYNVPTGTADLENTANFITNAVTDLVNYYTKTEVDDTLANYPTTEGLAEALADYYTKAEIDALPNGEDIDFDGNDKLQFANRIYNAQQPNGMGYKILRKDATFASQVTDTNTIYEIRYDFNLNGASVIIPSGCVLRFNGGKLSGGTVVGQNSSIFVEGNGPVFSDIIISGTWMVADIYSWWFSNDENTLKNMVSMTVENQHNNLYIIGNYAVNTSVSILSHTYIYINGEVSGDLDIMFRIIDKDDVHFFGGTLDGQCESGGTHGTSGGLLYIVYSRDVTIRGMVIKNAKTDCIVLSRHLEEEKANENIVIENCVLDTAWRQGVSIISAKNFRISNCYISNVWGTAPGAAMDFESNTNLDCEKIENVVIEDVIIENTYQGILFMNAHNNPPENLCVKNVKFSSSLNTAGAWIVTGDNSLFENCDFSDTATNSSSSVVGGVNSIFRNCSFKSNKFQFDLISSVLFENCTFEGGGTRVFIENAMNCKFILSGQGTALRLKHAENNSIELDIPGNYGYVNLLDGAVFRNNKVIVKNHPYYAINMGSPQLKDCVIEGNTIQSSVAWAVIIVRGTNIVVKNNHIIDTVTKTQGVFSENSYGHRCRIFDNFIVKDASINSVLYYDPKFNYNTSGNTANRPQVLMPNDIGFKYYDTTLSKFIFLKDAGSFPKFELQLSVSDLNNAQAAFATNFGIAETSNIPAQTTLAGLTNAIANALQYRLADVYSIDPDNGTITFCVARNQQLTVSDITMTLGGNPLGTLTLLSAGVMSTWIDATGATV